MIGAIPVCLSEYKGKREQAKKRKEKEEKKRKEKEEKKRKEKKKKKKRKEKKKKERKKRTDSCVRDLVRVAGPSLIGEGDKA